jgi:hypothetical protein
MDKSPFAVLKKESVISHKLSSSYGGIFFFWIKEDEFGAYVVCCDKKRKFVSPNSHLYTGFVGDALKLYNELLDSPSWQLDWGRDDTHLYLIDYPEFTELLLKCNNLLLPSGEPADTAELNSYGYLKVKAKQKDETVVWKVSFCPNDKLELSKFSFLTPSLIMSKRYI